jgi:hypothetical protein
MLQYIQLLHSTWSTDRNTEDDRYWFCWKWCHSTLVAILWGEWISTKLWFLTIQSTCLWHEKYQNSHTTGHKRKFKGKNLRSTGQVKWWCYTEGLKNCTCADNKDWNNMTPEARVIIKQTSLCHAVHSENRSCWLKWYEDRINRVWQKQENGRKRLFFTMLLMSLFNVHDI